MSTTKITTLFTLHSKFLPLLETTTLQNSLDTSKKYQQMPYPEFLTKLETLASKRKGLQMDRALEEFIQQTVFECVGLETKRDLVGLAEEDVWKQYKAYANTNIEINYKTFWEKLYSHPLERPLDGIIVWNNLVDQTIRKAISRSDDASEEAKIQTKRPGVKKPGGTNLWNYTKVLVGVLLVASTLAAASQGGVLPFSSSLPNEGLAQTTPTHTEQFFTPGTGDAAESVHPNKPRSNTHQKKKMKKKSKETPRNFAPRTNKNKEIMERSQEVLKREDASEKELRRALEELESVGDQKRQEKKKKLVTAIKERIQKKVDEKIIRKSQKILENEGASREALRGALKEVENIKDQNLRGEKQQLVSAIKEKMQGFMRQELETNLKDLEHSLRPSTFKNKKECRQALLKVHPDKYGLFPELQGRAEELSRKITDQFNWLRQRRR